MMTPAQLRKIKTAMKALSDALVHIAEAENGTLQPAAISSAYADAATRAREASVALSELSRSIK